MRLKTIRQIPESWPGVRPRQLLYPSRGQGGEEVTPPPAIRPKWSAGKRECPRKLLDPMSWQGTRGSPLANVFEEHR